MGVEGRRKFNFISRNTKKGEYLGGLVASVRGVVGAGGVRLGQWASGLGGGGGGGGGGRWPVGRWLGCGGQAKNACYALTGAN